MNTKMIVTLLGALSVGVSAGSCFAGYKLKADLTNLKCPNGCRLNCCEKDTTKCGGNTVTCASGKYLDATKAGMAGGADDAARKIACCTDEATCAGFSAGSCFAGYKLKADLTNLKCFNGCRLNCCEKDTTKCGGNTVTCASGKYQDATKAGMAGVNDAAGKTACCTDKATCAGATCAAGMKAKTSAASTMCASNAASCMAGTCCEFDTTKCGGRTPKFTCDSTDIAKAADTAGTTKAQCCMTKPAAPTMATCASFAATTTVTTTATTTTTTGQSVGSTSGAQKTAMSLFFAMAGVVALWK